MDRERQLVAPVGGSFFKTTGGNATGGRYSYQLVLPPPTAVTSTWTSPLLTIGSTTHNLGDVYVVLNGLVRAGNILELGTNPLLHNTDVPLNGFNMTWSGTGRMGIRTATPAYALHVVGASGLPQSTGENGIVKVTNTLTNLNIGANGGTYSWLQSMDNTNKALPLCINGVEGNNPVVVGNNDVPSFGSFAMTVARNSTGLLMRYKTANQVPEVRFERAQGLIAAPTITNNGTILGRTTYFGYDGTTYGAGARIDVVTDATTGVNDLPSRMEFSTSPDGTVTPAIRMVIKQNGFVGINTTTPTANLSVNGTADKIGGGTWAVFSDKRIKKDVEPYKNGLQAVLSLNPVTFRYNGKMGIQDTTSTFTGYIAQEYQKVFPNAVQEKEYTRTVQEKEDSEPVVVEQYNDLLMLKNQDDVTASLINAIKEQQAQIEALQKEVASLSKNKKRTK